MQLNNLNYKSVEPSQDYEIIQITRQTASKYLVELENNGILKNIQIKNSKYYINIALFTVLKKAYNSI